MTDSQVKYQQIMEDQRHNLAMERFAQQEQESKKIQAVASQEQAVAATKQAAVAEINAMTNRLNAETNRANATSNRLREGTNLARFIVGMLFADANTAFKGGVDVVTTLIG